MDGPAVSVAGVTKRFRIYHERNVSLKQTILRRQRSSYEEFLALKDVSFEVGHGQSLGIIGRNGSGKSTLLKCVAGIIYPDSGTIQVEGRLAALLELGAGFYPEYTGRENIYLNGALLGLSRRLIDRVLPDIVAFSELERFIDNTVKTYSSGMFARLGFSIAVHLEPQILVVDEILAVGDEAFQRRCYERIVELQKRGTTMVIVSHSLDVVKRLCTDCVWLDAGAVRKAGDAGQVIQAYLTDVSEHLGTVIHPSGEGEFEVIEREQGDMGVARVRILGPRGPARAVSTGDAVEIQIDYYANVPLADIRFALNFVREDGVEVFWTGTEDRATEGPALPPEGTVSVRIPSLQLLEGSFRLGVSIYDPSSGKDYVVLHSGFPLEVRSDGPSHRGVAVMESHWTLPAAAGRSSQSA